MPRLRVPLLRLGLLLQIVLLATNTTVCAQGAATAALPSVSVTGVASDPVEKSFRKMVRGMDYFEQMRAARAPAAVLRFRLLPRKLGTDMGSIRLEVIGSSFDYQVPIAADHTFVLARDRRALDEDAVVSPNRRRLSMTWRTEIRTPGLPPDTRRLGDLRLECQVGLTAELVSNGGPLSRLADLFIEPSSYCDRDNARYLFFAERPLFSVTLVSGARREVLAIDQLYATASDDPGLKNDLPFCDCELLVDRTYFLPLGDRRWPDDTQVEFEYMDERP